MFAGFLRQSTAATRRVGAFVDVTDAASPESGLAGNGTELSKAGAAFAAGPVLGTHDADGWYPVSLTTAHTDTPGLLTLKSQDGAVHRPVAMTFVVLPGWLFDRFENDDDAWTELAALTAVSVRQMGRY